MKERSLKKFTFYRLRFWLGYFGIGLAFLGLIAFAVVYEPGGLNSAEETSALKSATLDFRTPTTLLVSDLPYHVLQKTSISLFGLSHISVKLPSALIAFITGIGFVLLMRRWFKPSVSVIVGGIAVASTVFVYLAQQGTPSVMTLFWPTAIMLFASWGVSRAKLAPIAIIGLAIIAALSLYTPLSVHILFALAIGGLLHPHVRYVLRKKVSKPMLLFGGLLCVLLLLPLFYMLYQNPSLGIALLVGNPLDKIDIFSNLALVAKQFFDITGASNHQTALPAPFFILPILILALYGGVRLFLARHTAQNYILSSWLILFIPLTILNPLKPELLFVPMILLVGVGVTHLLNYWYRLFPANPYARGFGLMLLVILLGGVMLTCMLRYYNTYQYNPPHLSQSSRDLQLLSRTLSQQGPNNSTILVQDGEAALYRLYVDSQHLPSSVTTSYKEAVAAKTTHIVATKAAHEAATDKRLLHRVISSPVQAADSDRFYIYKNTTK
jgi:hypothetical protein